MGNFNKQSSSCSAKFSTKSDKKIINSSRPKRVIEKKLEWKEKNKFTQDIRMMTTRFGVSERVMHELPCRILEKCGACPTLDLPYKNQLLQKNLDFKLRLENAGAVFSGAITKDCVESLERLGYRRNFKLVVSEHSGISNHQFSSYANAKRWIDLGVYKQSANEVIDTGRCPIQTNLMNDISAYLRTGIRIHNISVYTPNQKSGLLHCIILRTSYFTRQVLVTLVVTKADLNSLRPLARDISEKFMNIQGVFMQVSPPAKYQMTYDEKSDTELKLLVGQDLLEDKYGDLIMRFSMASYMPVNSQVMARIYNRIEELSELTGKETILDLYCGAGGIALTLARDAREVIAIDCSAHCIKDAIINAKKNEINNVKFYESLAENILPKLIQDRQLQKLDILVLNPSKKGCDAIVIEQIKIMAPKTIFYLSSFIDSMFNDLKSIIDCGYKAVFFEPYDTSPGTQHYDVLCYLVRK